MSEQPKEESKIEPKEETVGGQIDVTAIINDPKVFEALLNHEKVKETIAKAVAENTKKSEPEPPKKQPELDDITFMKKKILGDAISKLDQATLVKFTLETEGQSLVQKMSWIDANIKDTPAPKPPGTGLPAGGGSKPVSYWDAGYKHQFIDNRKK